MNNRFVQILYPFLAAGLILVMAVLGFFLLSLLFIKALIVGLLLFSVAWVRKNVFPNKSRSAPVSTGEPEGHVESSPSESVSKSYSSAKRAPITFEHGEY